MDGIFLGLSRMTPLNWGMRRVGLTLNTPDETLSVGNASRSLMETRARNGAAKRVAVVIDSAVTTREKSSLMRIEELRTRAVALLDEGEQHFRMLAALNPHWSKKEREARVLAWVQSRTKLWSDEESS